ncbi:TrmH family RNA methyltransferase [Alkaliflexus imshenetskii]|uniref:TrmH family RNA methyltransferase n=1 Tax=Alkaliflexus imshenetskii TaxID=286730 RepID=UPI00047AA2AC|nr:RNA methyltransferase [Alkaliflexus imshenetskii]
MLSKNQKKLIAAMAQKKQRDVHGLFLAEGDKIVRDLLAAGMTPQLLVATDTWLLPANLVAEHFPMVITSRDELEKVSLQKTPQNVLGLFPQHKHHLKNSAIKNNLTLLLDGVQDPGNLGTIIRLADWFGIGDIVCSTDTADLYNPKVIQSSMGAIARVRVHYTNLSGFIEIYKKETGNPVYGTFLKGDNVYQAKLLNQGLLIMGNEGQGIRDEIGSMVTNRITIPSYPANEPTSESLNVGVATAILCSEFRRQASL